MASSVLSLLGEEELYCISVGRTLQVLKFDNFTSVTPVLISNRCQLYKYYFQLSTKYLLFCTWSGENLQLLSVLWFVNRSQIFKLGAFGVLGIFLHTLCTFYQMPQVSQGVNIISILIKYNSLISLQVFKKFISTVCTV